MEPTFYEFMDLFEKNITVEQIASNFECCKKGEEKNKETFENMEEKGYDLMGIDDNGKRYQCVTIEAEVVDINIGDIVSDSTPLTDIIELFHENPKRKLFVLNKKRIEGIVIKADLQKGPFLLFIFGLITNFEITCREFIKKFCGNIWEKHLSEKVRKKLDEYYNDLKHNGEEIDKLHCTFLPNLKPILFKNSNFCTILKDLNLSKTKAKNKFDRIVILRNNLAHSKKIEHEIKDWENILDVIHYIPQFTSRMRRTI